MDAFYEESAVDQNSAKSIKKYRILQIISTACLVIAIMLFIFFIFNMPFSGGGEEVASMRFFFGFLGVQSAVFFLAWFLLRKWKLRYNVSFDYCFVSGELRISKVFNINKRKLIARIDCSEMIQVGDIDNPSYERFKSDPTIKEIVCTPNFEAGEGKFFMYVLAQYNGKKLFILECRELLLMNIMKFAKRTVLESDYVMQERK